jgi:hypothetical protein
MYENVRDIFAFTEGDARSPILVPSIAEENQRVTFLRVVISPYLGTQTYRFLALPDFLRYHLLFHYYLLPLLYFHAMATLSSYSYSNVGFEEGEQAR